ncbi:hypothetical protein BQ8794_270014 [Mesorhizobium prunaredense]|uniref:Uncharacterized protein n=1 Tax=Mesorhizobium prunaredense TaxID=1631249 RepID=A0A1R3V8G5_9HYPH|nr:hypothetical protein BQ8794_270014 [Mesorhizobium prunaredense]
MQGRLSPRHYTGRNARQGNEGQRKPQAIALVLAPACLYIAIVDVPEARSNEQDRRSEKTFEAGRNQKAGRLFQARLPEPEA